jgi:hypothetical protein
MNLEETGENIREGARRFATAQPNLEAVAAAAGALSAAMRWLPLSQQTMERFHRMAAAIEAGMRADEALAAQIEAIGSVQTLTVRDIPPDFRAWNPQRSHLSNESWRRNGKKPGRRR